MFHKKHESKDESKDESKKEMTIKKIDKKIINEIKISESICKICFYDYYFFPILDSKRIFISNIENILYDSIADSEYILITKNKIHSFDLFIEPIENIDMFIKIIIETYLCLLNSLEVLEKNRLCYFHLNERSLGFNDYKFPVLHDFSECFRYEDILNLDFLNVQGVYLCLDYFVLSFLKSNKSMSKQNMNDIIKNYVLYVKEIIKDLDVLDFERRCNTSIKKWINKDIAQVDLNIYFWDVCSLHMFFLDMINSRLSSNDIHNIPKLDLFIKFFKRHLLDCICPEERITFSRCRVFFEKMYKSIDWSFI